MLMKKKKKWQKKVKIVLKVNTHHEIQTTIINWRHLNWSVVSNLVCPWSLKLRSAYNKGCKKPVFL